MSEELDRVITKIKYRIHHKDPTGFEDAVKLSEQYPESAEVWHTLAYAHETEDEYTAAIAAITRAIELSPKEPALFFERGGYALNTGEYERAVADFSQGLVLSDEFNWDYYREALHFMRAEAFVQLGKKAEALADLSHVADDRTYWTTKRRSKADLLALCGEEAPMKGRIQSPEPEEPGGIPEYPDDEEAALAKELGEAGLAAVDAALLKHVIYRYQKASRVIIEALNCDGYSSRDDPRICLYARRLIALAEAGLIEARGNLYRPSRSEVRLPKKP